MDKELRSIWRRMLRKMLAHGRLPGEDWGFGEVGVGLVLREELWGC